jgi:hypothetical protein
MRASRTGRDAPSGPVDAAGSTAAEVANQQLERPADRQRRPVALPERVDPRVHPDPRRSRPAAHDDGADRHGGREQSVHVELVVADGLDRGDDPGQVLGQAAGHDGRDRDLFDGGLNEVGRNDRDDLVGWSRGAFEHGEHSLGGWGHERQTIAPPHAMHVLEFVFGLGEVEVSRSKERSGVPGTQGVDEIRVDAHRSATWTLFGKAEVLGELIDAGQGSPLLK